MHLFGLTGGIASGKSAVAARLRARGVPVIDADQLAREAVEVGTPGLAAVVDAFGAEVVGADGSLDRKKLASLVFGDDAQRRRLNSIVHPEISRLTLERAAKLGAAGHPLACYEAALIVENGIADAFRPLVVVATSEDLQVARARVRDDATDDEIRARIRAQMPLAEKVAQADFVVQNDGTKVELDQRTDAVLTEICRRLGVDEAALSRDKLTPG